jgi:hypothetical protein
MKYQIALLVILRVGLLEAGEPEDLMKALERLKGITPISARVQLQSWSERTLNKKPTVMHGSISLVVSQNSQGLQTSLASRFVEQIAKESLRSTSDSDPEQPIRSLLKDLDYGRIHHLLDQEEMLHGLVASSKFTEGKAETWEGQMVRTIECTFRPRLSPEESYRLNHSEGHLAVRVNADGLPLQSEIKIAYEGKTSRMFGRYLGTKRTETRYKMHGDHLIVSERTVDDYLSKEDGSDITKTRQIYSVTPE